MIAIAIIALISIAGANASFCNQLVESGGITVNQNPTSISTTFIKNVTIQNFTAVSNYTVCYSATVNIGLTVNGLGSGSFYIWDLGGFPAANPASSKQIISKNPDLPSNITTIAQCQAALNQSYLALCSGIASSLGSTASITKCTGMGVCCTGNNCNTVIYFSSASALSVSIGLLLLSLIASVSNIF